MFIKSSNPVTCTSTLKYYTATSFRKFRIILNHPFYPWQNKSFEIFMSASFKNLNKSKRFCNILSTFNIINNG